MPLNEDEDQDVEYTPKKPNVGKGSFLDKIPKKPTKEQFEKAVKEIEVKKTGYQKIASEITQKYFDILKDKTLAENQSPIQTNFRKEVLEDMLNFAIDLNNDDLEEKNDMGSIAMISILLRSSLALKDFSNKLEYDIKQLKNEILILKKAKEDVK